MRFSLFSYCMIAAASSIIHVNDKNFKEAVIETGKFTLVDFYADWCRHCQKLMPTIEKLAELYEDVPEIQIVKINGDADGKKMTKKYEVPGFPMLLMFHGHEKPVEYEGGRDLDSISNFVQSISGIKLGGNEKENEEDLNYGESKIVEVNDSNFQEQVLGASQKTLVAFTTPQCSFSQKLKPVWSKLANKIYAEDENIVKFAEVDLGEENKAHARYIADQFGITQVPMILLFDPKKTEQDGLKRPVPFTDTKDLETLLTFINEKAGLHRNATGGLSTYAGRINHLDEALKNLLTDPERSMNTIEDLGKSVLALGRYPMILQEQLRLEDDASMIPYYARIATKVSGGDTEYANKELVRLQRIISNNGGDLERNARDYMQKRINILMEYLDN